MAGKVLGMASRSEVDTTGGVSVRRVSGYVFGLLGGKELSARRLFRTISTVGTVVADDQPDK